MTEPAKPAPPGPHGGKAAREPMRRAVMILLAALCLAPWASPPIALAVGIVVALLGLAAFEDQGQKWSGRLIQLSVVLLGLRLPFDRLLETGLGGLAFAAGTILGALALGWLLGRLLRVDGHVATLLSSGTAICGGSAIGAVGSAIGAASSQIAVAMGTVFLLNAAGLYLFPIVGHALHLNEVQFGTWTGIALHDVASVVGAARSYDTLNPLSTTAMETATVVKLSRVVWIVPIALIAAWMHRRPDGGGDGAPRRRMRVPWFIAGFAGASAVRTFVPAVAETEYATAIAYAATAGMTLALFLIGTGLSVRAIRGVGWRALAMGAVLWLTLAGVSLGVILATVE